MFKKYLVIFMILDVQGTRKPEKHYYVELEVETRVFSLAVNRN